MKTEIALMSLKTEALKETVAFFGILIESADGVSFCDSASLGVRP